MLRKQNKKLTKPNKKLNNSLNKEEKQMNINRMIEKSKE